LAGGGCHDMLRRILSMAAEQNRPARARPEVAQPKTQELTVDAAIAILFGISNRADDSFIPTLRYPRNEGMLEGPTGSWETVAYTTYHQTQITFHPSPDFSQDEQQDEKQEHNNHDDDTPWD